MIMQKILDTEMADIPEKFLMFLSRNKIWIFILFFVACFSLLLMLVQAPAPDVKITVSGQDATNSGNGHNGVSCFVSAGFIGLCIVVDIILFALAFVKVKRIDRGDPESTGYQKLSMLEAVDIFFDLPLYFGLFGTVLGFLLMEWIPSVSRTVAYLTTLGGILVSSALRVFVEAPCKERWTKERMNAPEYSEQTT